MSGRFSPSAFYLDAVGGRRSLAASALRTFLAGLEPIYGAIASRRARLYDEGRSEIIRVALPVISVGNLTVGGTGKSPMVEWLARRAVAAGLHPGILCRGYGRAPGDELNDEARWLREALPTVPIVCDADRVRGAAALAARGAALAILDDGFQHRRLARDFDLVLLDAAQPFGFDRLLPRGLLREPAAGISRAHAIVLTRCDQVAAAELERLERRLETLAPKTPRFRASHGPAGWIDESGERQLDEVPRGPVGLISALARPDAFERTVRDLGFEVAVHHRFSDHHRYRPRDLERWEAAPRWITTTKDWVKLRPFTPPRLFALRIEMRFEAADPWPLVLRAIEGARTARRTEA